MDDSQWCDDECPTCATVVHGGSIYCSAKCEPHVALEPDLVRGAPASSYVVWAHRNNARVSAWAMDCFASSLPPGPAHVPPIFPSPSQRKLHLRNLKQHPSAWVTHDAPLGSPPSMAMSSPKSKSTSAALEALASAGSPAPLPSPLSLYLGRRRDSWAPSTLPSPVSPRHRLTKTNVSFDTDSTAQATPESSDRPLTPSELWVPMAENTRSKSAAASMRLHGCTGHRP